MRQRLAGLRKSHSFEQAAVLRRFALPFAVALAAVATTIVSVSAAGALFLLAVGWGLVAEVRLARQPGPLKVLSTHQFGYTLRCVLRDLLLLMLVGIVAGRSQTFLVVLGGCWWLTAVRFAHVGFRATIARLRSRTMSWRNLEVAGLHKTARFAPRLSREAPVYLTYGAALVAVAFCLTTFSVPLVVLVAMTVLVATSSMAVLVADLVDLRRAQARTDAREAAQLLTDALERLAPEVVLYFSRPERTGYIANVWIPTLEQSGHRVLVVVREDYNRSRIATKVLPIVQITNAGDLERLLPTSVRIALYPSNVAKNNHLIRLPGIVDVFVGHGDSDKGGSATTLSRIYDEIWVSGPAAQERYRVARVGVRDEQIRQIGRPQLTEIGSVAVTPVPSARSASPTELRLGTGQLAQCSPAREFDYTVLYAPTREGFYAEWEYSSVLTQGRRILKTLLAMPGVRVLFKPHPGTGTDDPRYRREVRRLTAMVKTAGSPHEVVGKTALYQAFNLADLLVSDVSSVITDFLASSRPYVVTSSATMSPAEFREAFPSARGGYVLSGKGSGLAEFVDDARERDSLREERSRCATSLLGAVGGDPLARFDQAVDDAIARFAPEVSRSKVASVGGAISSELSSESDGVVADPLT